MRRLCVAGVAPATLVVAAAAVAATSGWKVQRSPEPSGAIYSTLGGVSCSSRSSCAAVGQYTKDRSTYSTLAETWNGKKWSIDHTANPTTDPNKFLFGVSCTSASACTAAGYTEPDLVWQTTVVEHWNGHKWLVQQSPSPGSDSELNGVSCSSPSDCTAAGWYEKTNTGPTKTFIERR